MTEVFDRERRRVAILENAFAVTETQNLNALWNLRFSLPAGDPKNQYCQPFCYVRHDGGELYRIMPSAVTVNEAGSVTYQCEHVLATLIDNVLFGYHVVGNRGVYTDEVIQYILDHQIVKNWTLLDCEYRNQFEYGWEQESLLSALFSVAKPLTGPYMWVTDTSVYPWRLSLKKLDTTGKPEMYIRRKHNLTSFNRSSDPKNLVTRLYPLGYGEGVNQLGIAAVNGGIAYLQSPKAITDKYGIIERVWVDRRYEDAASLKAAAEAMLKELQEPLVSYEIGFQELNTGDQDKAAIGKRARIVVPELGESVDTFVTGLTRTYDDLTKSTITVANRETSIAASVAEMADRQRVEQTYSQGATQLYSQALQANCDKNSGAVMDFFIPNEMRIINKVLVKVRLSSFRAYSKATEGGGNRTTSTGSGGGVTATSEAGGACTRTSSSGGGSTVTSGAGGSSTQTSTSGGGAQTTSGAGGSSTQTSTAGGGSTTTSSDTSLTSSNAVHDATDTGGAGKANHNHGVTAGTWIAVTSGTKEVTGCVKWEASGKHTHPAHSHTVSVQAHTHNVTIPSHQHSITIQSHTHSVSIPSHQHSVTIGSHEHSVSIPNHTHSLTIKAHTHDITIPAHVHTITPGIFTFGNPSSFSLYVNDAKKETFSGTTAEVDITSYLLGQNNMIPRGSWLSLEIRPDDLAYVSIDLIVQGFVQSRGDNTV